MSYEREDSTDGNMVSAETMDEAGLGEGDDMDDCAEVAEVE